MSDKWRDIGIREKMQIVNGTVLIASAIILYFVAFIITLSIGFEIVSAGATLLATGLAFFGISSFVKNSMIQIETKVEERLKKIERKHNEDDGNEEIQE